MSSRRRVRNYTPNITSASGGDGAVPTGGSSGLFITEQANTFNIAFTESNAAQTESVLSRITATNTESNPAQTEAIRASLAGSALNDSIGGQTEVRTSLSRYFATTTSDNDSSRTTPANANGQPDSTNSTIRTNLLLGDLTNPVVLTSTAFASIPTTGTYTAKTLRSFFSIPARVTTADTIVLQYSHSGGAFTTFYTHTGTAAVNNLTTGLTFDVSALTLTQAASIQMRGSYTANIVATPETQINLDAWCVELQRTE